jgi:hypothetical protein
MIDMITDRRAGQQAPWLREPDRVRDSGCENFT